MTQQGLFDRPRTHVGDPPSSHRAEAESKSRAKGHAAVVLVIVRGYKPGLRASQIAGLIKFHPDFSRDDHTRLYQVRRRLSDLRAMGLVRRQSVKGSREVVWYPVDTGTDKR